MSLPRIKANARTLTNELNWLRMILDIRFKLYFNQETYADTIYEVPTPDLSNDNSLFAEILKHYNVGVKERIVLLLAIAPHFKPQLMDIFFMKNPLYDRVYTEFGGIKGNNHNGFLPTGETAAFVIGGNDLTNRALILNMFRPNHYFRKYNIISLNRATDLDPILSSPLGISDEFLHYFTTGTPYKPTFSSNFPASRISTNLNWEDLVLDENVLEEIEEITSWLRHGKKIMTEWELGKKIKPGYRTLFYGPPGTGKSLTAALIGKNEGVDVYRIDLSQVVSKYIGETEKNMANIFDQAENKNWILFFDEADALFGKRTGVGDSKDRHANQEVAYLLQRIEDFPGVVILATNLKTNIDDAFARRFQSMIHFAMPTPELRSKLWKTVFSSIGLELEAKIDLEEIAYKHEIAGGAIINILRYAALMTLKREKREIKLHDIMTGIRKEFAKEGKTMIL
jgi:AAA+ superfamily predicted ATPase